jgi:hypothetical protein
MGGHKWFKSGLKGLYLPMQLTDWLLLEVALLLLGLTQISSTKYGFNHLSVIESHLWLQPKVYSIRLYSFNKPELF